MKKSGSGISNSVKLFFISIFADVAIIRGGGLAPNSSYLFSLNLFLL